MDNRFDFDSKKYIILLILVCSIFAIVVIKAFDYLPDKSQEDNSYIQTGNIINKPVDQNSVQNNNAIADVSSNTNTDTKTDENVQNINRRSGVLYKSNDAELNNIRIEEIDAPKGLNEEYSVPANSTLNNNDNNPDNSNTDEATLKLIINAKKCLASQDYTNAMNEYNRAIESTNNNELLAESYEGIAIIYAKNKRFGTALSFASKAYKASPSIAREFLIAKIYYNSGNTDAAITRINALLKQSF